MENLRTVRKSLGLTQEEAAKALKISRRSYQSYESLDKEVPENKKDQYDYLLSKVLDLVTMDETHGILNFKMIKDAVNQVCSKYDKVSVVYLFGSYARGEATPKSDVDLLFVSDEMGLEYFGMVEEIRDLIFRKKIDAPTYKSAVNDAFFLKEVLRDGVKIYDSRTKNQKDRMRYRAYRPGSM